MGKVIKKKMNGMSWWMKTSIVLLLTMATSLFMYQGWYQPVPAQAATVTYGVTVPSTASTGIDGLAQFPTAAASVTTAPTVRGNMSTTLTTSGASYRPTTGMTNGTAVTMLKLYSPAYATAQTITAPSGSFAIRGYNASDTWTFHVYSHNPNGVAGNKTLMYSSNTTTSGTTATVVVVPTYTLVNSAMPAGYKLLVEIVYTPGGTVYTPRIYVDGTANTSWSRLTVTETTVVTDSTPPIAGTVTITPDVSSAYTSAAPTISTQFTDAESAVSACEYTTNGTTWLAGVKSGTTSPYTCTANPTGLTGFLNINMRATSTGGTTTATQIQRTVDTSVPTDGTLTVTAGNAQNSISWTAATDPGGSGIASYILRFNTGVTATAPANCTTGTAVPGSPFTAATLSTPHTGLTNGNQYAYRLCAVDNLTNTSGGVTKTVTPAAGPVTTIGSCSGCHGYSATSGFADGTDRNAPLGQFKGSHSVHPNACATCHTAPATTTSADFNHANATVNMAPAISGGSYVKGSVPVSNTFSPSTCNNTTCHGGSSPTWGTATTQATCTKCHGVLNTTTTAYTADPKSAAPGYNATATVGRDTAGLTSGAKVGAHDTHLRGLNTISNPVACTECHSNVNTTSTGFTGHMDGTGTLSFGTLATTGTGTAPNYSAGTCTNTYCHYGRTAYAAPATANASVVWSDTAYLGGTTTDCQKCHASPPSTTGSHAGVNNINQCNGCHNHVTTAGTFSDPSKHINGIVEQQGCNGCHGWPPTTNGHTVHIDNIIAEKGLSGLPGGFVDNQVCGTCHNVSSTTKHAGTVGNDGTSRNIYSPTPSILQATYQFGANAVSFDGAATTCSNVSCHLGTSTAWGDPPTSTCQVCHGYPPVTTVSDVDNKHATGATAVNHIGTGATVNTKVTFVSAHGGCQICHGTQDSGTGTQAPHANYNVTTEHFTGNININGPTGIGTGYNTTNRGCDAACHANDATHQMTASAKTLTFGNYGTGGDCISCHTVTQPSPVAAALDATVTSRVAIAGDFTLTSSHTRSRASKTATKEDCCVCHMEGDVATGSPNGTYHKNGYVELRDPDLGTTIKAVTHSGTSAAAGAYTSTANDAKFVRFKRNLGIMLENETAVVYTGVTNFQVIGGIMVNHCLKCHDANGATSTTAQIPAASGGSAFKPFGATVAANGTNQGVLDVAGQFASTNRAFHPVLVKQNNGFTNTGGTRMVAPWNASVAKTATTTVYGPLISCWDCHAPNGSTSATTVTTTMTHGKNKTVTTDAVELRGSVYLSSTTTAGNLCLNCHVVSGGTTLHGTGSAYQSGNPDSGMTYLQNRCYFCHSSVNTNAHAARPFGAGDVHGYNARGDSVSAPTAITIGGAGYAFIRRTGLTQVVKSVGATSYTATCGTGSGICSQTMGTYTPGGVF
jgi:predicted CxxxxCH...CXXCH cytochrome family protein